MASSAASRAATASPTIEAAGMLLAGLEKRPDIAATLNGAFARMLTRFRQVQGTNPELAPRPKPRHKRDFRRRKRGSSFIGVSWFVRACSSP